MSRPGEPNPSTTNSLSFRLTAGRPDLQEMANTLGKLFSPSVFGLYQLAHRSAEEGSAQGGNCKGGGKERERLEATRPEEWQ